MPDVSPLPPPKTVAVIVALYVDCGFSTYRIAEDVGIDRQRVGRLLRKAGVALPQRGQGRRRPLRVAQATTDEMLRKLYVDLRMPSTEIGAVLGISDRLIRSRLRRAGISLRSKGKWDRRDRTDAEKDDVSRLYVDQELTAGVVGGKLGVSRRIVLRSAHTYGLAVRAGGMPRPAAEFDIRLIEALYEDRDVALVLSEHSIPVVRQPGPIWERFPAPVPLTDDLLAALYVGCGLACFHIELLTGQPAHTVLQRLEKAAIARRPRGGRSPFMRRWLAGSRASDASAIDDLDVVDGDEDVAEKVR
jgi:hypothetical protein